MRRRAAILAAAALTIGLAAPAAAQNGPQVTYRGVTFAVPRGWPIYHLTPHQCVRLDRHAVYLGTPGADQNCPAELIGRTETLLVQPYRGGDITPDSDSVQGRRDGLLFTASVGAAGPAAARALLPPSTGAVPAAATPAIPATAPVVGPTTVQGAGFDACRAPARSDMQAWANSSAPYKAVGIYIGGLNRGCPYGNLSAAWVSAVRGYGYRFIPTYVGRQAPCSGVGIPITPSAASSQGLDAARDALHNMAKFGFPKGSPVYLDMENYVGDDSCKRAVLQFVSAWVYRLHLSGYLAGLYTSSWASIVRHHNDGFRNPDAIWIGRWNDNATVFGDPVVPDNFWANHQRIHQYKGAHAVRYGDVTLTIDTDELDAPVG
jgi:hypothetical protein